MKKILACLAASAVVFTSQAAFAGSDITVKYNDTVLAFNQKPLILNEKTLVQLRPIAEAMGLGIKYSANTGSIILSDSGTTVVFTENSDKVCVNDTETQMAVPAIIRNNYTFVPVRELVEPFGDKISYDSATRTVTIRSEQERAGVADQENAEGIRTEQKVISIGSGKYPFTFFYQSQPDIALENNGRGYCWVCSYALLLSDLTGKTVLPSDVGQYNVDKGYAGNYISSHTGIIDSFGCEFVPALPQDSKYYAGFNLSKKRGETMLNVTTDEDAANAIKEALDANPKGVLVRYEKYPHTMVAVGYDDNGIYFNDPGVKNGEHVTFEETCLKNLKLSDISYMQAIGVKK